MKVTRLTNQSDGMPGQTDCAVYKITCCLALTMKFFYQLTRGCLHLHEEGTIFELQEGN